MAKSKNDIAWELIFIKYDVLNHINKDGMYLITSKQINEFREARLMTKFDYRSQRPQIFFENNLSILPVTRGSYVISNFETFCDFETSDPLTIKKDFPNYLESINYDDITSESTALNCAFVSKMINDFTQDEEIEQTISGRMSSSDFEFKINTQEKELVLNVQNSQLEVDGGYEGVNYLSLIEAKNSISNDFLIRQLYYPYRLWSSKINKSIKNIFLTYTNGVFHFREYGFDDINHYNSIQLIKEKKYIIRKKAINNELIQEILHSVEIKKEPKGIPFPQADSFDRVINLCELLYENDSLTREFITINYDFDVRQTNYYTDAGRYLGIIDKKKEDNEISYFLTPLGCSLFRMNIDERQLSFIRFMLSYRVFNEVLKVYFRKSERPNRKEAVKIMQNSNLYNIRSLSTFERRSSTVLKWVDWIIDQREE